MPLITVIIPAHNAEGTIAAALRSAQRALPRDSDIAVYDDASTDQTVAIAERMAEDDRRISITCGSQLVGSGIARRALMERTDSRYIANLDADDIWFPWHIRRAIGALQNSDVHFASAVRFWTRRPNVRPTRLYSLSAEEVRLALLLHNPLIHSSLVARRRAIESVGGYSTMRRWQDYELWLRLAQTARIAKSANPSVGYRQSTSQVSRGSGYVGSLDRDGRLSSAYEGLLHRVLTGSPAGDASAAWSDLWRNFRPRNRAYYRRLHSSVASPLTQRSLALIERSPGALGNDHD